MKKLVFMILLTCFLSATAQKESRYMSYFCPKEVVQEHLKALPCIGEHPDSLVGSYCLSGPGAIASLELRADGTFECYNFLGALIVTYGHWDLLDESHLNLNTGKDQIEVEEFYIKHEETLGKSRFYCLKEVTMGYYVLDDECELNISIDGQQRQCHSDENGELMLEYDKRIESISMVCANGLMSNVNYMVKNPLYSNIFIIKRCECLQLNNVQWELSQNAKWFSINSPQFEGCKISRN
jgi:hypothetical protein